MPGWCQSSPMSPSVQYVPARAVCWLRKKEEDDCNVLSCHSQHQTKGEVNLFHLINGPHSGSPAECVPPFDTDGGQVTDCVMMQGRIMDCSPECLHCFIHCSTVPQANTHCS
ncbi:hypothetical protein KUCAC02_002423 [Chaenocephalus aceratus]|uniref:Uncharacterized protein n=1 Tax=Chaenocephalus aceratus TaxID=36190 RepID=A0ACB9XTJ3_CHAAC|nr:hypothetical protein KUCAC02_002423 [Chaenocephalus aceratus]